jgi:hypothetical protein
MNNIPAITHVAIRFQDRIWSLPRPYRHHHVMRTISWLAKEFGEYTKEVCECIDSHGDDQGFLDASGSYLTRKEAFINASANDQIKNGELIGSILTSEDIW